MQYNSLMHIGFFTDRMEDMVRFYTEVLGGTVKVVSRYGSYLNRDDRPAMQAIARVCPDDIFNIYVELAPGQIIEFFPGKRDRRNTPASMNTWDTHISPCVCRISVKLCGNWRAGD